MKNRCKKINARRTMNSAGDAGTNLAVIYCRVSTQEQVENFSLSTQEKGCREYCAKNGFDVDKVFVEEGESAKTANRTEFNKMLAYCRESKGRVKWLVVFRLDRFSRRQEDHHAVRGLLAGFGVTLRSVSDPIDETSTGKLMEGILAAFNQFDNDVRSERTAVGMKAGFQLGKWMFKAPLGYLNNGRKSSPSLIHDPERGHLVRQGFELYATGVHTKRDVLNMITSAGLRTAKGKKVSPQTFNQMLLKPVYAGWLQVDGWGERVRGDFEPLVTQETFDKVQALLKGKQISLTPRLRSHPDFPLRWFVKCGCCGRPLTASWNRGHGGKLYPNYRCQNGQCKAVSVTKKDLERGFVEFLEQTQPKPGYLKLFKEVVLDVWREKQTQNLTLRVSLKQRIENLNERKERLEETFIYEKTIDRETYQRQLDKLNEQIVLAEMQERDAKLESYDVDGVLAFAEHVLLNAARLWTEFSSDQKERLQSVLFPKGVTFLDGNYRTTEICPFFNLIPKSEVEKSRVATLPGIEPGLPP